MLVVVSDQMKDVSDFHKKWYVNDLIKEMTAR